MLLCSGLSFQESWAFPGFPGLSWHKEGCLMCGTGHAAVCSRQLLSDMCVSSSLYTPLIITAMMVLLGFCLIGIIIKGNWCQQVSTNTQPTGIKLQSSVFQVVKTFSCTGPYRRPVSVPMNAPNCMLRTVIWPCWPFVSWDNITAVQKMKQTAARGTAWDYWLPGGTDQQRGTAEPAWTHKLPPISWPAVAPCISPPQLCGKGVILSPRGNKVKLGVFISMLEHGRGWFTANPQDQMKHGVLQRNCIFSWSLCSKISTGCEILEAFNLESPKWLEIYPHKKHYCYNTVEIEVHQLEPFSMWEPLAEHFQCSVPFWVQNTLNWYWFSWWASKPVVSCLRERIWPSWGLR